LHELIAKRIQYAASALHGEQKYAGLPYSFHLEMVADICLTFQNIHFPSTDAQYVLYLAACHHDVLEDTTLSYRDLVKHIQELMHTVIGLHGPDPWPYTADVANIVYNCTQELGKNRKERTERTYPKLRSCKASRFVKCCDRLANMLFSYSTRFSGSMWRTYCEEYPEFRNQLWVEGEHPLLWDELDMLYGLYTKSK